MHFARTLTPWLLPTALTLGSLVAALWIEMQPPPNAPLAAVFPPWWSATRAMVAASSVGPVVRFGALPFVIIASPGIPNASAVLHQQGAWFILNAEFLGACGKHFIRTSP